MKNIPLGGNDPSGATDCTIHGIKNQKLDADADAGGENKMKEWNK